MMNLDSEKKRFHFVTLGILPYFYKDIFRMIWGVLDSQNLQYSYGDKFDTDSNAINVLTDVNAYIVNSCHIPIKQLCLLLTEFPCRYYSLSTFNLFYSVYVKITLLSINKYYLLFGKDCSWINTGKYADVINKFCCKLQSKSLSRALSDYNRFLSVKEVFHRFGLVFLLHPSQSNHLSCLSSSASLTQTVIVLYPPLTASGNDCSDIEHLNDIEITGTVTEYRKQEAQKVLKAIGYDRNYNLIIKDFSQKNIGSDNKWCSMSEESAAPWSIHPPQNKYWLYSSPARIHRAVQISKTIPILTKKYNDHPIEHIAFSKKEIIHILPSGSYKGICSEFKKRVDAYNIKAADLNNAEFMKLERL